jgi:hypothetical protein
MILSFHELKCYISQRLLTSKQLLSWKSGVVTLLAVTRNASSLLFMLGCSRSSDTAL